MQNKQIDQEIEEIDRQAAELRGKKARLELLRQTTSDPSPATSQQPPNPPQQQPSSKKRGGKYRTEDPSPFSKNYNYKEHRSAATKHFWNLHEKSLNKEIRSAMALRAAEFETEFNVACGKIINLAEQQLQKVENWQTTMPTLHEELVQKANRHMTTVIHACAHKANGKKRLYSSRKRADVQQQVAKQPREHGKFIRQSLQELVKKYTNLSCSEEEFIKRIVENLRQTKRSPRKRKNTANEEPPGEVPAEELEIPQG